MWLLKSHRLVRHRPMVADLSRIGLGDLCAVDQIFLTVAARYHTGRTSNPHQFKATRAA